MPLIIACQMAEHLARQGASVLDQVVPDWRTRINALTLDMESGYTCILGQLFGNYNDGVDILDGLMTDAGLIRINEYVKPRTLGFLAGWQNPTFELFAGVEFPEEVTDAHVWILGCRLDAAWRDILAESV